MNKRPKSQAEAILGAVAIGRNEGERLKRCLRSLQRYVDHVVYVDSGSTDGSVEFARTIGAEVVELNMELPFTMARARNRGAERLVDAFPNIALVQFLDGDCELRDGWIERAVDAFARDPAAVAVCGRRRERNRDASIYNRLMDMEWDGPVGEVESCHGDVMIRMEAFSKAGGFRESMIAGEEPELCLRLRRNRGKIIRLDAEMSVHDAAMSRFSQWWTRARRAGHAAAEGAALHGVGPERHKVRQVASLLAWGLMWPLLTVPVVGLATVSSSAAIATPLVLGMPVVQWVRIRRQRLRLGAGGRDADLYAWFCLVGKPAGAAGVIQYWLNRLTDRQSALIEYKGNATKFSGET